MPGASRYQKTLQQLDGSVPRMAKAPQGPLTCPKPRLGHKTLDFRTAITNPLLHETDRGLEQSQLHVCAKYVCMF